MLLHVAADFRFPAQLAIGHPLLFASYHFQKRPLHSARKAAACFIGLLPLLRPFRTIAHLEAALHEIDDARWGLAGRVDDP